MGLRQRLMFATAALLYSGPLYAGLAGYGFETIPLFALLFMLWLQVVRPGDWPETRADWLTPRALAWPLLIFSAQLVLVGFCLAVGRGIGGALALEMPLPFVFTFFVTFMAIALARLLRSETAGRTRVPGAELGIGAGILDIGSPLMPSRRRPEVYAEATLSLVADFGPNGASAEAMEPLLNGIDRAGVAIPVLDALDAEAPTQTVIEMQARLALRPRVALSILGEGRIGRAMARVLDFRHPPLIEEAAGALRHLVAKLRDLSEELPSPKRLRTTANDLAFTSPAAAAALRGLAAEMEAVAAG